MDRPLEESQLAARTRRGDLDAYARLVEMHQTIAFRTAFLVTGSAAEAEEAAQDAFLKAHRALGRFDTLLTLGAGGDPKPPPKNPTGGWYLAKFVIDAEDELHRFTFAVVPSTRHLRC